MTVSRYMEVHDNKITRLLGDEDKQNTLSRYLRMKKKLGLNYLKPEIEGLESEKEQALLTVQDQRKKLIYDKEEMTIITMQNNELRRMIGELQKDNEELKAK